MSYFKNVTSFENLKTQFRALAHKNHPDAGGDPEVMKEINVEFDALFKIWKDRHEEKTGEKVNESAGSYRREFYTAYGWAGSNYDSNLSTKEICKIIRTYVKEKYPTYKFSVRFSRASMCTEIYVSMKESPLPIYKTFDELTGREALKPFGWDESKGYWGDSDIAKVWQKAKANWWIKDYGCYDEALDQDLRKAYEEHEFLKVRTEIAESIVKDVDAFVDSYRREDCDGMIDYFDVSDYYFGCKTDEVKVVPKTARISHQKAEVKAETEKNTTEQENALPDATNASEEYTVEKTKHTKTGADIWVVRWADKLSRDDYLDLAEKMKGIGAYYSRYVHGFVFKEDPTSKLAGMAS